MNNLSLYLILDTPETKLYAVITINISDGMNFFINLGSVLFGMENEGRGNVDPEMTYILMCKAITFKEEDFNGGKERTNRKNQSTF